MSVFYLLVYWRQISEKRVGSGNFALSDHETRIIHLPIRQRRCHLVTCSVISVI